MMNCFSSSFRSFHGDVHGHAGRPGGPLQLRQLSAVVGLGPRLDRALLNRLVLVGHHQIEVELDDVAETMARRARPEWIIERKQPGLGCFVGQLARLAFKPLAEHVYFRARPIFDGEGRSAGFQIRRFNRVGEPRAQIAFELHAIDNDLQARLIAKVCRRHLVDHHRPAIDVETMEALAPQPIQGGPHP